MISSGTMKHLGAFVDSGTRHRDVISMATEAKPTDFHPSIRQSLMCQAKNHPKVDSAPLA